MLRPLTLLGVLHRADPQGQGRRGRRSGYHGHVPHPAALVDEIANELGTWPGVSIDRRSEDIALVLYERFELGVLDRKRGVVELHFSLPEHDELVEHGDAEPADSMPGSVSHLLEGPSDVTAVIELFDRRYRDLRGEDDAYSSQDL
jgi:hypothetical protein